MAQRLTCLIRRGIVNTFGVYQAYYESTILSSSTSSAISWIGTIQGFLLFLVGILTGPLFDKGHFRALISTGTFLVVFGMMMTSLSSSYYQIFLAQGVCVGLGAGCLFVPSVAIMATYFTTKRALMTGITAAGGSIGICAHCLSLVDISIDVSTGGVIFPIVFRRLQPTIGFGWATRVIAFLALGMLIIPLCIMRTRTTPKKARALLDLQAFREAPFNIFSLGLFLAFVGLYFPFFYAPIYGSRIVGLDSGTAFYLLAVMNAGSIFGRVIPGLVADKAGSLNTIIPCGVICAVLAFAWLGIENEGGMWVFSALYGTFSGAIVSLPPTIVALISPDMSLVGTRMGMCFTFAGLGLLIGNPIAGAILNIPQGKFEGAQAFSAVLLIAGVMAFVAVRMLVSRTRKGWKA